MPRAGSCAVERPPARRDLEPRPGSGRLLAPTVTGRCSLGRRTETRPWSTILAADSMPSAPRYRRIRAKSRPARHSWAWPGGRSAEPGQTPRMHLDTLQDVIDRTYGDRDRERGVPRNRRLAVRGGRRVGAGRAQGHPRPAAGRIRRRAGMGRDACQPDGNQSRRGRRCLCPGVPQMRCAPLRLLTDGRRRRVRPDGGAVPRRSGSC